jgi:hypothetical protein
MSASSTVLHGRRKVLALMVDTIRVVRPDPDAPEAVMDPATGQYVDAAKVTIYRGPGRVQVRADINSNAVEAVVGEREGTYRTATVQFPIDTPAGAVGKTSLILPDDEAIIEKCPLDPEGMEGRHINLQADTKGKTHATHRRFRSREPIA